MSPRHPWFLSRNPSFMAPPRTRAGRSALPPRPGTDIGLVRPGPNLKLAASRAFAGNGNEDLRTVLSHCAGGRNPQSAMDAADPARRVVRRPALQRDPEIRAADVADAAVAAAARAGGDRADKPRQEQNDRRDRIPPDRGGGGAGAGDRAARRMGPALGSQSPEGGRARRQRADGEIHSMIDASR